VASQRSEKFVDYVLQRIHNQQDRGFAAKLKKADNEATEYQSWELLAPWVNLEHQRERKAYCLVGAHLARSRQRQDGTLGMGAALRRAQKQSNSGEELEHTPSAARLRRILACHDTLELIDVLRPVLRLLASKEVSISHARLLDDILWFHHDAARDRIRSQWAQEFFGRKEEA